MSSGARILRDVPLWSERLGLRGKSDVIEMHGRIPYPVEYKLGGRRGIHADLQLCAQALCLEEMLQCEVPAGAIYHHATRKRREVQFTSALRAQTVKAVDAVRQVLASQQLPPAPNDARCPNCSLINACLPNVVGEHARLRGIQGATFRPLALTDTEDSRIDTLASWPERTIDET
jgi:CRISPR-associated exonuclease Cas4